MHIINQSFLKLALLPKALYTRIGVNAAQLKTILTTKLILDDRRPRFLAQTSGSSNKKPPSMATLSTMLMSALMGVVFLAFLFIGDDIVTQLTIYFSLFFVLLSLTLITDFTTVLIDVRDNFILLPKPVNDKTIVVARLLHIFIHLCKIVLPMCLPGLIYLAYNTGIYGAVLFLLQIVQLSAFSIFFINAAYIVILQLTTPQRFQSIITYVQIVFAIVIYGAYQLFPRLIARYFNDDFTISDVQGIEALPPYWFANSWKLLYNFGGSLAETINGIAGLIFPLFCIVLVVNYLAPSFNRKLSLLSSNDSRSTKSSVAKKNGGKSVSGFFSRIITNSPVERASFLFTWKMTGRSRDFKLKVFPSIGYLVVYAAFIFFSNDKLSLEQLGEDSTAGKGMLLSALYLSVFLLIMAIGQVVYSEKYKASWIFHTSPVAHPGHILTGMAKAILLKFYFPISVVVCLIALPVAGISILPNLLFGLVNVLLIVVLTMYAGKHYFPFSAAQSTNAKAGSFLKSIFIFAMSGLVVFGHFFIYSILPVVIICTALSAIAVWLLFDSLRNLSWNKILSAYIEE